MKTLKRHSKMLLLILIVSSMGRVSAQDKTDSYQKDRLQRLSIFKEGEFWDFAICSSTSQPSFDYYHCVSGNEIVMQIDNFYANSTSDRIRPYIDQLPSCVNRDCIQQYYLERYYQSCDEENSDDIIRYGETYLKTGGETELSTVLPTVAKLYAIQGNETEVEKLINEFELYSIVNDDLFEEDIEQLKQETYDLLHPKRFENGLKGAWVNIINYGIAQYGAINPMVLFIDSIAIPEGAKLIEAGQSVKLIKSNGKRSVLFNKPISISQGICFNGETNLLALQFASEDIKDRTWLTDVASMGVEDTRKLGAELNATIWSSNASLGDKALYGITTSLFVAGMESLFSNINYSTRKIEQYNIALSPFSDNVLSARMLHVSATVDNEGHVKESNLNDECKFVRWEESDNIVFVSTNGNPITLKPVSKDDPILDEYNAIKKQTSFWQPKYLIPFFVGNAAGAYLVYAGIDRLLKYDDFDKYFALYLGGITTVMVSSIVPTKIAITKRDKLYKELNEKNIEKLQKKYRAEFSISPSYNPTNNAIGATVNVQF